MIEIIMKFLDDGNFVYGIFVDLKKAFYTVDHNILLSNLSHYGTRGVAKRWFEVYLCEHKQFVSVNGFDSDMSTITCVIIQGSFLGPLLFLIYINDLAIKYWKVHHHADDTNLLNINKSPQKLNKSINADLKIITNWLNANEIYVNVSTTELLN